MAYAVKLDLADRLTEKQLVELTDFDNAGVVVDSRITAALDAAAAQIDSYAGGRYKTPLAASDQVKNLCLDLTVWQLFSVRNRPLSETLQKRYDAAMKFLMDVSKGLATLDGQGAGEQQASEMDVVTRDHETDPEVFDDNKLENY